MPRAALSADEIHAFRKRAVAAATKLFADHGYEAVTMRAIADELGTSAMAPYRYFANKAEIFALVRAEATRALNDQQERELYGSANVFERLVRARAAYVRFALEYPDQYRVIFERRSEPDEAYPELLAEVQRSIKLIGELGRLAVEAGVYAGDPVIAAHLMWAQVHGLISLHHAGRLQLGRTLEQILAESSEHFGGLKGRRPLVNMLADKRDPMTAKRAHQRLSGKKRKSAT